MVRLEVVGFAARPYELEVSRDRNRLVEFVVRVEAADELEDYPLSCAFSRCPPEVVLAPERKVAGMGAEDARAEGVHGLRRAVLADRAEDHVGLVHDGDGIESDRHPAGRIRIDADGDGTRAQAPV